MPQASPTHPRYSLRAKWSFALLLTVALPMALFFYATRVIQKQGLEDAERQMEVAVIDHVTDTVERTLRDASDATHRVGQLLTESHISDDEARLRMAEDALARAEAITQVAIYSPDGGLIDAILRKGSPTGPAAPEQLAPEWKAEALHGAWLPPVYPVGGGASGLLRYLEPVERDGVARAWVMGTLGAGLSRRLDEVSRSRFDSRPDGVLLLDNEVRVLSGPSSGPLAVGTMLRGHDIFGKIKLPSSTFGQAFGAATEFVSDVAVGEGAGQAMVGTVQSIPALHLGVAVRRPASVVYLALGRARRLLLEAGGLLALLALVSGGLLAARTTRPVATLVELTRAYARRDFAARSTVKTSDELEVLGDSMSAMADELQSSEKEILRRAGVEADLSRYLPGEVARSIAAGTHALALGGERRTISILFADVVSFTSFSEEAPPERVVAFLNELFTVLTEVVFRHGGTVDKFIGDCVMAIFGAPRDQPDHAARALAAAEDMHRFIEANAPAWKSTYGVDVALGIGVNCGEAIVGNLGSDSRMEYTAIGDAVNVAARLEGLARPGQTLLTAEVAAAAGDGFSIAPLGAHEIRGKKEAVQLLELT